MGFNVWSYKFFSGFCVGVFIGFKFFNEDDDFEWVEWCCFKFFLE